MANTLIFEGGLSPEYVLDKMELWELPVYYRYLYLRNKHSWEQARMIGYIIAQSNSTKKLKPTDIISFGWDLKDTITEISNRDIERLRKQAKQFEKNI